MSEIIDKLKDYIEDDYEDDELLDSLLDFVSLIDLDSLDEEQVQKIDKVIDLMEEDDYLSEKTVRVVRGGKRVRRKVCPAGKRVQDGKCVKQSAQETRKRSRAAKRAAKKKHNKAAANRKRQISIKRRG